VLVDVVDEGHPPVDLDLGQAPLDLEHWNLSLVPRWKGDATRE
jgi:hypothetical protein